jgi:hypothetical protein
MEQMVFFSIGRTFFTYVFVVKYIFALEATSRVEKSNILLRGKKYYYSRKNVRGCGTFAFLISYGIENFYVRNFPDK